MKKSFLFLTFLMSCSLYAQEVIDRDCHRPMFSQGKSWNFSFYSAETDEESGRKEFKVYPVSLTVDGDTLIDGTAYWKLYRDDSFTGKRTFNSAWREEDGKVFSTAWNVTPESPGMQYLFLLEIADLLPVVYDFSDNPYRHYNYRGWPDDPDKTITCDVEFAIDTILVSGRLYRRFTDILYYEYPLRWVEGIGSNGGLYSPWDEDTALDCFCNQEVFKSCSENGEVIFTLKDFLAAPYHEEALGIGTIGERPQEQTPSHDLQGRRLAGPPAKGVYIRDGKKVVIK